MLRKCSKDQYYVSKAASTSAWLNKKLTIILVKASAKHSSEVIKKLQNLQKMVVSYPFSVPKIGVQQNTILKTETLRSGHTFALHDFNTECNHLWEESSSSLPYIDT